jgi:hypothetical protein
LASIAMAWRLFPVVAAAALLSAACWPTGPSRLTVVNRTTQDVVIRFGHDFSQAVFVPACDEVVFDPARLDELPTAPQSAVEVRYQFPFLPDAPTIATFTVTSERVWTGEFPSPPPCEGLAPTPTPLPTPTPTPTLGYFRFVNGLPKDQQQLALEVIKTRLASAGIEAEVTLDLDTPAAAVTPATVTITPADSADGEQSERLVTSVGVIQVRPIDDDSLREIGDLYHGGEPFATGTDDVAEVRAAGFAPSGSHQVNITLVPGAGHALEEWTSAHIGKQVAVTVDGMIVALAPVTGPVSASQGLPVVLEDSAAINAEVLIALWHSGPMPVRLVPASRGS